MVLLKGKAFIRNTVFVVILISFFVLPAFNKSAHVTGQAYQPNDSVSKDTTELQYPFKDDDGNPFSESAPQSPLFLNKPSNISSSVNYDPVTNQYILTEKIGEMDFRRPTVMSFKEFYDYDAQVSMRNYWVSKSRATSAGVGAIDRAQPAGQK